MSRIRTAGRKRADTSIRGGGSLVRNHIRLESAPNRRNQPLTAYAPSDGLRENHAAWLSALGSPSREPRLTPSVTRLSRGSEADVSPFAAAFPRTRALPFGSAAAPGSGCSCILRPPERSGPSTPPNARDPTVRRPAWARSHVQRGPPVSRQIRRGDLFHPLGVDLDSEKNAFLADLLLFAEMGQHFEHRQ